MVHRPSLLGQLLKNEDGRLHRVAVTKHIRKALFRILLPAYSNAETTFCDGMQLLHLAALLMHDLDAIQMIIDMNPSAPFSVDGMGRYPLVLAILVRF